MRQPQITRDQQIALACHNAAIARSKRAYYDEEYFPCGCSPDATCNKHRGRAAADLIVATSEEECERLLRLLDRPPPLCANGCGRVQESRRDGSARRLCWTCRHELADTLPGGGRDDL